MAVNPDLCNIRFQLLVNLDQLNLVIEFLQQFVDAIHASCLSTRQDHQISTRIGCFIIFSLGSFFILPSPIDMF